MRCATFMLKDRKAATLTLRGHADSQDEVGSNCGGFHAMQAAQQNIVGSVPAAADHWNRARTELVAGQMGHMRGRHGQPSRAETRHGPAAASNQNEVQTVQELPQLFNYPRQSRQANLLGCQGMAGSRGEPDIAGLATSINADQQYGAPERVIAQPSVRGERQSATIAEQTNLLALNAAIEGRQRAKAIRPSFAVVADEVTCQLAQRVQTPLTKSQHMNRNHCQRGHGVRRWTICRPAPH